MTSDTGDAFPGGGYLAPNIPPGWLGDAPLARAITDALDAVLDRARADVGALRAAHLVGTARGADLDDLAALLGLERADGETDAQLRLRIPATVQHGVGASTAPDMSSYLGTAAGVPVSVSDGHAPGTFVVTFSATPHLPVSVLRLLVRRAKALGTTDGGRQLVPSAAASVRAGDVRLGTRRCGGTGAGGQSIVLW